MKVIANIASRGNTLAFEGTLLALKPGETLSFLHVDYHELSRHAVEETHMRTGSIPVIVHDDQNNFVAFMLEVEDGKWKSTSLEGYMNADGQWQSGRIEARG